MVGRIKRLKRFHFCLFITFLALGLITIVLVNVPKSKIASNGKALSDQERSPWNQIAMALKESYFIAATRINTEQASTEVTACAVDPALIECDNKGFAAMLLVTLDFIFACQTMGSDTPIVFWRNCNSGCSKDPSLNSWNWYFEPVNQGLEFKVKKVICPLSGQFELPVGQPDLWPVLDSSFRDRSNVVGYQNSTIITQQQRIRVNRWLNRFVRPNARIKQKVNKFFSRYLAGKTLLGVQVRATDHFLERREGKLPTISDWINKAASIFERLSEPRKIFIASDNTEVINHFVKHFGQDKVFFIEATRAKSYHGNPPHALQVQHNPDQFHKALGTQVLMDILLLAKCDHFLHIESSVAALASYFNPDMKSHFLDDTPGKLQDSHLKLQLEIEKPDAEEFDEDPEVLKLMKKCFEKNSPYSACPNIAKGIYVDKTMAKNFVSND